MNERIRELANKSFVVSTQGDITTTPLMIENFAELIIRECIEWCDAHATINGTAQQVRDSIKQHFGVEE